MLIIENSTFLFSLRIHGYMEKHILNQDEKAYQ